MTLHELTIGGATIGGPLGSRPGLLVGSIFYDKHSLVTDAFAGIFDEDRAARLLARVDGLASRYGLQRFVWLVRSRYEAAPD
jgi:tetrahydromethanopterin S-methyltransferase subunit H